VPIPWTAAVPPGVSAAWSFGDGTTLAGANVSHAFARPGLYPVAVSLDDGRGLPNSRRLQEVYARVNAPPVAIAGPDRTVCPGDPVVFDGRGSRDIDGMIAAYRWQFSDGVVMTGPVVERAFDTAGPVDVTLTVTDASGAMACNAASDTLRVKVNGTPSVDAGPDRTTFVGAAHDVLTFEDPAARDPDGDGLILSWDFGDAAPKSAPKSAGTKPRAARAAIAAPEATAAQAVGARVSHAYALPGTYTVTVTARDTSGLACGAASDTATITALARE
jgi:hypothetical protein